MKSCEFESQHLGLSDPINIFLHKFTLRYFKHFDWSTNLSIQSDCFKNWCSLKFTQKIFIGPGPYPRDQGGQFEKTANNDQGRLDLAE